MGAYYKAVIDNSYSVNPHKYDNGMKLMEHSYLGNNYCSAIENVLKTSRLLVWLCDYHEKDETYPHGTWDDYEDKTVKEHSPLEKRYFINHTKEVYIDVEKLVRLSKDISDEWVIHPLPILCNSERSSAGGGDYHKEDSRRATWCNDEIQVILALDEIHFNYTDCTEHCIFKE